MKTLLIGINAKFIHSNLAIRYLKEYAQIYYQQTLDLIEFTINQRAEFILAEIYRQSPDIIGFSCYIWNFELVVRLISEMKKILPNTIIFLGGPEVSYDPEQVLTAVPADIIVSGEGEETVSLLVKALKEDTPLTDIPGLTFRQQENILRTGAAPLPKLEQLPFVYHNIEDLEHRILYYESSRGCPFRCQYCLSCYGGVRFRPLEQVFTHLDFFLKKRVAQVKFVDRTFNCNPKFAMAVWKYLSEHDNGCTNFHFEIAAELLNEEMLSFLPTVRKGLFQLEIGVQSTNPKTLEHIQRNTEIEKLRIYLKRLHSGQNIHLHLDLIIGLPYENYQRFAQSFNDVYALWPHQLQVGFLKLLKGSGLYENREQYGIVSSPYAPYEVLSTNDLTYGEILKLKMIEEMVERYYNSNRFQCSLAYLNRLFPTPFALFEAMAEFYESNRLHFCAHTKLDYYTILYHFFLSLNRGNEIIFKSCAKFDLFSHEKVKKFPDWLPDEGLQYKAAALNFYSDSEKIQTYLPEYKGTEPNQIYRLAAIEKFAADPLSDSLTSPSCKPAVYLFRYQNRDLLGNAAHYLIELEESK